MGLVQSAPDHFIQSLLGRRHTVIVPVVRHPFPHVMAHAIWASVATRMATTRPSSPTRTTSSSRSSTIRPRHPLEGPVRDQAWNPLAFGLLGQLLGGVNADFQAGMAHFMAWSIFMGLGFMFSVAGAFITVGGVQLERRARQAAVVATEDVRDVVPRIGAAAPAVGS